MTTRHELNTTLFHLESYVSNMWMAIEIHVGERKVMACYQTLYAIEKAQLKIRHLQEFLALSDEELKGVIL